MSHTYSTVDVPVAGGDLRVAVWDAPDPDAPTALLIHGITASHKSWATVARRLPGVRLIAPDLRGRGRSSRLGGGEGMSGHARDMAAVLDHFGVDSTLVVGHSMGGFVSVVFAHQFPERVDQLVLVDGGVPLRVPKDLSADQVIDALLGPAASRLAMRFPDVDAYATFWRAHPAFAAEWTEDVVEYLTYDLEGEEPELRPATSYQVMVADTVDMTEGTALSEALTHLRHPAVLAAAPRGLLDETPGLYTQSYLDEMLPAWPTVRLVWVDDVNHYTVVIGEHGAAQVAELILSVLRPSDR